MTRYPHGAPSNGNTSTFTAFAILTSGVYLSEGKAVKVTPSGVEVQEYKVVGVDPMERQLSDKLIRFDANERHKNTKEFREITRSEHEVASQENQAGWSATSGESLRCCHRAVFSSHFRGQRL